MTGLVQDLRYALRQLRRAPGFTVTAIITLALGIGATSTILSWISATLFNPIPAASGTGRMLTFMRGERTEHPTPPLSYPDYVDLRQGVKSFSGILAYHEDFISITGNGTPERIFGELTSSNFFEVLGLHPLLGRTFAALAQNEHAGAPEAILSYALWERRFAADPNILGKTIQLNLHPYTIIGVTPPGFRGCTSGLRADIWLPLGMDRQVWGGSRIDNRAQPWLNLLGVLKDGVSPRQADNELNLVMQRIVARYPTQHVGNNTLSTDPLWRTPFGANVYLAGTLPILLGLAALLLLLASANVANLLLIRTVSRRREFAIRFSTGASRWRLIRQLLIENLMVASAGGTLALGCTLWTARTLDSFLPATPLPLSINGDVDSRVLLATVLVSIVTAIISSIAPALRASGLSPVSILKDEALGASGGLGKSRLVSGFVIAQVALSLLLLSCGGLFVRSLRNAQKLNPGFDPSNVLLASLDMSPMGYSDAAGFELQRQLISRVRQLPGVQAATLADFSPLSFTLHSDTILPEGYVPHLHETVEADRGDTGPGYLAVMRTPLLAGRDFNEQDTPTSQPVIIVNQALVDRYWPGQNAIGKRIQMGNKWNTIVGVVANGKYRRLTTESAPLVLRPLAQHYADDDLILHVRAIGDPQTLVASVQQVVHDLNPNLPLFNVTTLENNVQMGSSFQRMAVTFAGSFGLLAVFLASIGLYGIVAYTTRQRTREIGIRIALGAGKINIFRHVLLQGLWLTAVGTAVGVVLSIFLTRFVRNLLFGVGSADIPTFAIVVILLCAVALIACYLPARRAASIDPMQALRTE